MADGRPPPEPDAPDAPAPIGEHAQAATDPDDATTMEALWEDLVAALLVLDPGPELDAFIEAHLADMDHAGFFERLQSACVKTGGDADGMDRFRRVVERHLRLSQGTAADYLLLTGELLEASERGELSDFVRRDPRCADVELLDVLIGSIEHATDAAGQLILAGRLLDVALAVADVVQAPTRVAVLHLVHSGYLLTIGQLDACEQAIAEALAAGPTPAVRDALRVNEGLLWFRRGDYGRAIAFMERHVDALADPRHARQMRANLGIAYHEYGWFGRAEQTQRALIAECRESGDSISLARALGNLANLYRSLGLDDAHHRLLQESVTQARAMPRGHKQFDWNTLITNFGNLCRYHVGRRDWDTAARYLDEFKQAAETYGAEPYVTEYAQLRLSLLLRDVARNEVPEGMRAEALRVIRTIHERFNARHDYEFLSFLSTAADVATDVGEAGLARQLLSELVTKAGQTAHVQLLMPAELRLALLDLAAGARAPALERIRLALQRDPGLRDEIADASQQFSYSATHGGLYRRVVAALREAGEGALLYSAIQNAKGRATAFLSGAPPGYRADDFPPGVRVIDYFLRDGEPVALLCGRDLATPRWVALDVTADALAAWEARFRDDLTFAALDLDVDPFPWLGACARALLWPLMAELGDCDTLVICPSAEVEALPFHLFPRPDGRRLIETHAVAYAPSAAILVGAMANADSCGAGERVLCSTRFSDPPAVIAEFHREAERVARWLATDAEIDGDIATQGWRDIGGEGVLHLACHGEFMADDPLRSGLHVRGARDMVWLRAEEMLGADQRRGLVFLSGCDTGVTGALPADERVGMVSSLLARGTGALIVSRWPILATHPATVDIVTAFYRRWRGEGLSKARALRQAMLAHRDTVNPYAWAGYVLIGDPR